MSGHAEHRPGCPQGGWDVTASRAIPGLVIKRCRDCGAVELKREAHR